MKIDIGHANYDLCMRAMWQNYDDVYACVRYSSDIVWDRVEATVRAYVMCQNYDGVHACV